MQSVANTTTPCDHREIEAVDRADGEPPEPGQPEDGLREERSPEREADVHSEDRDDRQQGVADHVPPQDARFRRALGARGAHVVLGQRLDHVGADHPHVGRGEQDGERRPRQDR